MTDLRVLFLQGLSNRNGRESLSSRRLLRRFRELAADCMLGHVVVEAEIAHRYRNDPAAADFVSHEMVMQIAPNVIFLEGGLFGLADDSWRIPQELAVPLVQNGAALIVADADWNRVNNDRENYRQAGLSFGSRPRFSPYDDEPLIAMDSANNVGGWKEIICRPENMILSEWARPIYEGVRSIVAGIPVPLNLEPATEIIASGNDGTTHLLDVGKDYDEGPDICAFGSARRRGAGYFVLLSAGVSSDVWAERCPDNTIWLTQLAQFLVSEIHSERDLSASHHRSQQLLFLSHRSVNKRLVEPVEKELRLRGIAVWFDSGDIVPSDSFVHEIHHGLEKMTHFVLFWSHDCIGSEWVRFELDAAVKSLKAHKKPIFVIRLDNTELPESIADLSCIQANGMTAKEIASEIARSLERLTRRQRPGPG